MKMRILIAGREPLSRSALRFLLQKARSFEVVGEAADSDELLAEVKGKHPHVVLLEWQLPGQSVLDLLTAPSRNPRLESKTDLNRSVVTSPSVLSYSRVDPQDMARGRIWFSARTTR